jgi:Glycosyl transferase family 2
MSLGVAGTCVVRDAVDLVPYLCGHYLRAGFAHLAFVDDGSRDGTFTLLRKIARRTGRVSVRQVRSDTYNQAVLMTETANELIEKGYRIIVPFDSDEFWNAEAGDFERMSVSVPEALFQGHWVNFVQSRTCIYSGRISALKMRFRAPAHESADRTSITAYSHAFVCHVLNKVAFKTRGSVDISLGQHVLMRGPEQRCGPSVEIFHLPLRSREEIIKRGLNYEPRRAPVRSDPSLGWQSAFHRRVVLAGKVDEVWASTSFDKSGRLELYGTPLDLIPDDRLRRTLIRAAWHLLKTYRLMPV